MGGAADAPPECGTEPLQVHDRDQYPSPPNNRPTESLMDFITLNASERDRADYSAPGGLHSTRNSKALILMTAIS